MTDKRQKATKVKCKRDEFTTKTVNFARIYSSLEKASEFCWSSFTKDHKTLPESTRRKIKSNKLIHLEPHDYRIYNVNIDLGHQYGMDRTFAAAVHMLPCSYRGTLTGRLLYYLICTFTLAGFEGIVMHL